MASPYHFRRGWDREKLAEYILSRLSFVAKPSTVSDDLGTDLFCTLFKLEEAAGKEYPLPLSSFAIQIKSDNKPTDFSTNIDYLRSLEIPFLWGVINESEMELSIFSGENLRKLFHHIGPLSKLIVKPVERSQMFAPYDPMVAGQERYSVFFPKILSIRADADRKTINESVENLKNICSMIYVNIASCTNHEYIFQEYDNQSYSIIAGRGSADTFRDNFMKRLAENFYNLEWLLKNGEDRTKIIKEFMIYEKTYLKIKEIYPIHGILTVQYEKLKQDLSIG